MVEDIINYGRKMLFKYVDDRGPLAVQIILSMWHPDEMMGCHICSSFFSSIYICLNYVICEGQTCPCIIEIKSFYFKIHIHIICPQKNYKYLHTNENVKW